MAEAGGRLLKSPVKYRISVLSYRYARRFQITLLPVNPGRFDTRLTFHIRTLEEEAGEHREREGGTGFDIFMRYQNVFRPRYLFNPLTRLREILNS